MELWFQNINSKSTFNPGSINVPRDFCFIYLDSFSFLEIPYAVRREIGGDRASSCTRNLRRWWWSPKISSAGGDRASSRTSTRLWWWSPEIGGDLHSHEVSPPVVMVSAVTPLVRSGLKCQRRRQWREGWMRVTPGTLQSAHSNQIFSVSKDRDTTEVKTKPLSF